QPLLPEVAGGSVNAADAVTPLRLLLPGALTSQGVVAGIDFARREVEIVQGARGERLRRARWDHLVLALGLETDLSRFPGLAGHAMTMRDLSDAFRLRNHVIFCLEQAEVAETMEERRRLLTFVIVGAGLSGIETAGEVAGMIGRGLRFYPRLRRDEPRIVVVEHLPRILPELTPRLADYAARNLQARGVELVTGVGIRSAAAGSVELADGRVIHAQTVVATIGAAPSALLRGLDLEKRKGRIVTDRFLAVPGHPGVWALGDAAAVPLDDGGIAPPTAQAAVRQARVLARNLVAALDGAAPVPIAFQSKGQLASLGARRGVASLFGHEFAGLFAWIMWRSFYLGMVPGWTTKVRVAVDWTMDALFPRNIVQIPQTTRRAVRRRRFRRGDLVFGRGEVTGPCYIVIDGRFERDDGRAITILEAGDLFGDGVLEGERLRRSTVRALDDSECLAIDPQDIAELAPVLASATLTRTNSGRRRSR
ncbi:MAG: FAD-dependent oxidoreductase, partial [Alphaproteobacteria bacterium]|nr:FAD-dependent oxidoreductase [Alphaproteobacteria bacterium]